MGTKKKRKTQKNKLSKRTTARKDKTFKRPGIEGTKKAPAPEDP